MFYVFYICASFLIGLISWWYYQFFQHRSLSLKYNGPPSIPFIGNAYRISSPKDIIPVFMEYLKLYGPVIKLWVGFRPRIIICDYRVAELLLSSTTILDKSKDYKFFEPWLGTGLITGTGAKWKRHRKLLTPTFHFQILEKYIDIFNQQSEVLSERLGKITNSNSFDIYPFINSCALDIVYESVMGIQLHTQKERSTDYAKSVKEIGEIYVTRMFSPFKTYNLFYKFTNDYRKEKHALSVLHGHTNFVITCKQEELKNRNKQLPCNEDKYGIKQRMAFLDWLLEGREAEETLTIEEIREEVENFMFAGHDTVASSISFTLYCLSLNTKIQEKVFEEIRNTLYSPDYKAPSYQELQEMKYLEMVIKESMRLYPAVPLFSRELAEDIEFDGVMLPKGTNLNLFSYGLHRQKEMFPDPEKFDPERFSLENSAKRSPFAYVPFSAGIRNCIGQRFAMLIMKSVISKILLNFELVPVPGYKPILTIKAILQSTNGIYLGINKRKV